jgi:hypothetical protein
MPSVRQEYFRLAAKIDRLHRNLLESISRPSTSMTLKEIKDALLKGLETVTSERRERVASGTTVMLRH